MYLYPAHLAVTATQLLPSGREIGHISPTVGNKAQQVALLSEYFTSQTRGVCNSITLHPAVMHCSSQLPSPAPVYSPPHTRCTKMHSRHCSPRSPYFLVIQDTRKTKQDATFSTLHTHCSLQSPSLLPMTMRQDLRLTTILRTENFLCRYSYKKTRACAADKLADQPCNMLLV